MSLNLMNKYIKLLILFFVYLILSGCDQSKSDHISETTFTYMDWGGYQRVIVDDSKPTKVIVSPTVLGYFPFSKGVFIVRQPVLFHDCKNGDTVTEITENIEVLLYFYNEKNDIPEVFDDWKNVLSAKGIKNDELNFLESNLKNVKKLNNRKSSCI